MRTSEHVEPGTAEVLADDWGVLTRYSYRLRTTDGTWIAQTREAYDRGHGATCLLHDAEHDTILLVRQFRLPVYLAGTEGHLVETPAGLLDGASAAERMHRELEEETGFRVGALTHLFDLFMSPGSVTEYLAFFTGSYRQGERIAAGGGDPAEGEAIEVLHMPLDLALARIGRGEMRDAKTVIAIQQLALALGRAAPPRPAPDQASPC